MRINKYIAQSGVCSRRKADELTRQGRISVNGSVVVEPGVDVKECDVVTVDGRRVSPKKHVYIALHKPAGYTCTLKDKFAAKKVMQLIPRSLGALFPVGRLDRDSSGLILLTNDGDFAERVTHPRYGVEKEYEATVIPMFRPADAVRMTAGIMDDEEKLTARSVRAMKHVSGRSIVSVVMKEGKKREVRRMFSALRYHILRLERVRIGPLLLGSLRVGQYRPLTEKEKAALTRIALCVFLLWGLGAFFAGPVRADTKPAVKPGVEVLLEKRMELIAGKRVGLVTNRTGVDSRLRPTIDLVAAAPDVKLVALYGPEHGIRGGVQGTVADSVDERTGAPVYSLYGATRRPTKEMLKGVEILLFDLQDIGSRSYTYISTMRYCLEEAAKNGIKFIVLDRPNPVNGLMVDGPALDPKFSSFIGAGPLAYVHGMTMGEIARFFNGECGLKCDLEVVAMEGWRREMSWRDTGLVWVPTSPHIPEPDTPWFYATTGIFGELPLVSVGVGYPLPFKLIGAPWLDGEKISARLNAENLPGVYFQPFSFKPYYLYYKDEECSGFRIVISDEKVYKPVTTGYHIMGALLKAYPDKCNFSLPAVTKERLRMFDQANGTDTVRLMFEQGLTAEKIIECYQPGLREFMKKREKYLLYK